MSLFPHPLQPVVFIMLSITKSSLHGVRYSVIYQVLLKENFTDQSLFMNRTALTNMHRQCHTQRTKFLSQTINGL